MSLKVSSLVRRAGKALKLVSFIRSAQQLFFQDEYIQLKSNRVTQVMLSVLYKDLLSRRAPLFGFEDIEFRAFSQNSEDGILLYIFALIGTTNKRCVEICGADGLRVQYGEPDDQSRLAGTDV